MLSTGDRSHALRPAWRLADAAIERDAMAFWERLALLPAGVSPEQRASELAAVAYQGDRVIGAGTAAIGRIAALPGRFAMLRAAVDPEQRRGGLSVALAARARDLIERWSLDHPEEGVLGLGALVEGRNLAGRARQPYWPRTRLGLIGYAADGRQIRVAWFAQARLNRGQ